MRRERGGLFAWQLRYLHSMPQHQSFMSNTVLWLQIPLSVGPRRQQWWLKWLDPCHLHGRPSLSSLLPASSLPSSNIAGIWGLDLQMGTPSLTCLSCSLYLSLKLEKNKIKIKNVEKRIILRSMKTLHRGNSSYGMTRTFPCAQKVLEEEKETFQAKKKILEEII